MPLSYHLDETLPPHEFERGIMQIRMVDEPDSDRKRKVTYYQCALGRDAWDAYQRGNIWCVDCKREFFRKEWGQGRLFPELYEHDLWHGSHRVI